MSTVQERPASTGRRAAVEEPGLRSRNTRQTSVTRSRMVALEAPEAMEVPAVRRRTGTPEASRTQRIATAPRFEEHTALEARDEIDSAVIRAIKTKQKRKRVKSLLLLKVGLVFILGLLVVFRYASITEMGYKVSGAKDEYAQLSAENERLQVQIQSGMNLDDLTLLAKERFDMQQPQTYQMVVLDIQPTDQTEIYEMELAEEPDNRAWYTKIYDSVREFLGII